MPPAELPGQGEGVLPEAAEVLVLQRAAPEEAEGIIDFPYKNGSPQHLFHTTI